MGTDPLSVDLPAAGRAGSGNSDDSGVAQAIPDSTGVAKHRGVERMMVKGHAIQVLRGAGHGQADVARLTGVSK